MANGKWQLFISPKMTLCTRMSQIAYMSRDVTYFQIFLPIVNLRWGTADAEIKFPCAENPELSNVLYFKAGVVQNIALLASPAARNFCPPQKQAQ